MALIYIRLGGGKIVDVDGLKVGFVCCTFGTNSHINGIMLPEDEQWKVNLLKKQNKKLNIPMNLNVSKSNETILYVSDDISPAAITNHKNAIYIERIKQMVEDIRRESDFLVVMPHIGGQYNPAPGLYARYIMDTISSWNVNMIIGSHPHVPLKSCRKNGVFCAYSLGNFAATPNEGWYLPNTLSEYGIVLHTFIDKFSHSIYKMEFDVVKNVVDDEGKTKVIPLVDLYNEAANLTQKERLRIDNEAVVSRFSGRDYDEEPRMRYEVCKI